MKDADKKARDNRQAETILKEHRRWTRWIEARWMKGEGNLVLTDRRLLFLHRIEGSPEVMANIKRLADAPMTTVLDYALTLNKNNFQLPLSSITRVGIGAFTWLPLPRFCLTVSYLNSKKRVLRTVAFQFRRPISEVIFHPQITTDWGWVKAIKRATKES
jgi:hypothetical protein